MTDVPSSMAEVRGALRALGRKKFKFGEETLLPVNRSEMRAVGHLLFVLPVCSGYRRFD